MAPALHPGLWPGTSRLGELRSCTYMPPSGNWVLAGIVAHELEHIVFEKPNIDAPWFCRAQYSANTMPEPIPIVQERNLLYRNHLRVELA